MAKTVCLAGNTQRWRRFVKVAPMKLSSWRIALLVIAMMLTACESDQPTPEDIRTQITNLIPATVKDRADWAADIQHAFAAMKIEATPENMCSVLAVTEQESTFVCRAWCFATKFTQWRKLANTD